MAAFGEVDTVNPAFDENDYEDNTETIYVTEENENQFQNMIIEKYKLLNDLKGEEQKEHKNELIKLTVKKFYNSNQETIFFLKKLGEKLIQINLEDLFFVQGWHVDQLLNYHIMYQKKKLNALVKFYSLDTLQRKYGVYFVRELGLPDYKPSARRI